MSTVIVFAVLAVITVGVVAVALYFVFKGDDQSASSRVEPGPRSRTTSQPRSSGHSLMVRKPAQASNVPRPAPPQKARPVTAASPQPSRTAQRWKVVAPGDDHDGQIGTADPVHDYDDEFVYLKFSGDAETYAFRHAEVTAMAAVTSDRTAATAAPKKSAQGRTSPAISAPTRTAPPVESPAPPSHVAGASDGWSSQANLQRWSQGLSKGGRVSLVGATALVAAAVAVLAVVGIGASGRSQSYEEGYRIAGGREWAAQMLRTASADVVCQRMYSLLMRHPEKAEVITDKADYIQGCEDAMRDATS